MLAANFLLAHLYMQDSFPDDGDESLNQSLDSDSFYDIYVEDSVDTADYSDYSKVIFHCTFNILTSCTLVVITFYSPSVGLSILGTWIVENIHDF